MRYFAIDGLMRAMPHVQIQSGAAVVRGCRMIKSATEIALMQKASDITLAAYRHTWPRIQRGMTPADIGAIMNGATSALGAVTRVRTDPARRGQRLSTRLRQTAGGARRRSRADGLRLPASRDISPTSRAPSCSARPTAEQRKVWKQMREGQQIAIETARVGLPAGKVDDAVRAQYEKWGYGPGYKLPGTSHRTGHGIGLDGHEPVNLVQGETTPLAPGMCFSNEPGIYLPGKFGVRLEDCFHMGEEKPVWFSKPPDSIDKPIRLIRDAVLRRRQSGASAPGREYSAPQYGHFAQPVCSMGR